MNVSYVQRSSQPLLLTPQSCHPRAERKDRSRQDDDHSPGGTSVSLDCCGLFEEG